MHSCCTLSMSTQAVSALTKERDTLALKYKGASKKAAGAEGDADRIAQELATARQEVGVALMVLRDGQGWGAGKVVCGPVYAAT